MVNTADQAGLLQMVMVMFNGLVMAGVKFIAVGLVMASMIMVKSMGLINTVKKVAIMVNGK